MGTSNCLTVGTSDYASPRKSEMNNLGAKVPWVCYGGTPPGSRKSPMLMVMRINILAPPPNQRKESIPVDLGRFAGNQ